jgi:hypothetical protein
MISQSLLLPNSLRALILIGLLGRVSWIQAVTLPDKILYQEGYSIYWQGTNSFNEELRDYFTVIGGTTTDAGLVQQLRSEGKVFAYNVGYNSSYSSFSTQQLVDLWSTPFNNTLGGALPGGFDAIEIDEIIPYANGTVESSRIVAALGQLRAEYPDKIIAAFSPQALGWNPATYSNLLNGINNYTDLYLFEAYMDEVAAPGNVLWHANMATLIDSQAPGLIDKTIFALLSYQGSYPADTTTDIGLWGFLDAQMHAIRNHPVASRMPGVGSYTYTLGLTTDFMGRAMDHYYVQNNTDYFGDGDMTQAVSNPQFENSTAGWELATGTGGSVGIFNYNGEPVSNTHGLSWNIAAATCCSHGTYGLKTVRGSEANEVSYAATVEAGLTYNISAYVHAGAGGDLDNAKVQIMTDSGNLIAERLGSQITEPHGWLDPWRAITFNFAVNPGQEEIRIVLTDEAADSGDVFYWDFVQMEDGFVAAAPPADTDFTWVGTSFGSWEASSQWSPAGVPDGNNMTARFADSNVATMYVRVNQPQTVQQVHLDEASSYSLIGSGALQLGTDSVDPQLVVNGGNHRWNIPVTALANTTVDVAGGSSLELDGLLTFSGATITQQGSGTVLLDGQPTSEGGLWKLTEGILSGSGAVAGSVDVVGGTMAPGNGAGSLSINNDFTLGSAGVLQLEVGSPSTPDYDLLNVTGTASLAGTFDVTLIDNYKPEPGTSFLVLAANQIIDQGVSLSDSDADQFTLHVYNNRVVLESIVPPLAGDYNNDGTVNAADYTTWRDALGSTTLLSADGSNNGVVDYADYGIWKLNFGATASAQTAAADAAVPEPSSVGLLAGLVAMVIAAGRSVLPDCSWIFAEGANWNAASN